MKNLKLKTKFVLGTGVVLLAFCMIFSLALYFALKEIVIKDTYDKTEIIITEVEAVRRYVKDVLRPKMFTIVAPDDFFPEAMSTSYVDREVMQRFNEMLHGYVYHRASLNPRNPKGLADPFEANMIRKFQTQGDKEDWHGVVNKDNRAYFVRVNPIYTEKGCLRCHGDPSGAPEALVKMYGTNGGFGRKVGHIAGIDSISIPVDVAMAKIRERAIITFMIGFFALLFLFAGINTIFTRVIVTPLRDIADIFGKVASGEKALDTQLKVQTTDEMGELSIAFNNMINRLNHAQKKLCDYTEDLESMVAERNDLLQKILADHKMLQSVFDGITDLLTLIEPDYTLRMVNKAYMARLNMGADQIVGKKCFELLFGLDNPCPGCKLEEVLSSKEPVFDEMEGADGGVYGIHFYPILDKDNDVDSVIHYAKFITDQKKMEQRMMQTEKLASLGNIAAGVAHEMNNPLGVIQCHADLLMKSVDSKSQAHKDLKVIHKHILNCKAIVEGLLSFSRRGATSKSLVNINESIQEVVSVVEKQFGKDGVLINKNLAAIPFLEVDIEKMKQVYMNLLINAKQAINESGAITITTRYDKNDGKIEIVFADTGSGISHEIMDKIFDPFFTTKGMGKGTGLGLSVTYGIIRDHAGNITVDSNIGKGSTFTITLPLTEE